MSFISRTKLFAALGICALMFAAGSAKAATCTATSALTNPDATLTNSSPCGVGLLNDNNDDAADLTALGILGATWSSIDFHDGTGGGGGLLFTGAGGTSGSWAFDAVAPYTHYTIVLKDGGAPSGSGDKIFWAWFVVTTAAGCDPLSSFDTNTYCGLWSMYGDGGNTHQLSHMSLYGATIPSGTTPGTATPEPGTATIALLGLSLVGAGFIARRRNGAR
jgi:hypothetical protein